MRLEDQPIPSHPTPPKNWLYALRSKGYSGVACARFAPLDASGSGRVQHHHHHRPARGPARIVVGRASVPKNDGADGRGVEKEQGKQADISAQSAPKLLPARGDYVPAAMQGPRTAWHVLCATESLPKSLKTRAARKRFWRHIETLRRNRIVREGQMRRANRHVVVTLEHVGHDT